MPRPFRCVPLILLLSAAAAVGGQRATDGPEAVIRAMFMAMYQNDVASYEKLTIAHPLRSRLTAGGRVNDSALQDLKENPSALQIRSVREPMFHGKPATAGADGQLPVGTTALYVASHRGGPNVIPLVTTAEGWKIDVRWWVAMMQMRSAAEPPGSPQAVIRALLMTSLKLDRKEAARYLTDAKTVDVLFLGAPPYREPSGVLEAGVAEMPLVEMAPGEFYTVPIGPVLEGSSDPNRKLFVGLFGPIEMPFLVRKTGASWRVDAQPYVALMNR